MGNNIGLAEQVYEEREQVEETSEKEEKEETVEEDDAGDKSEGVEEGKESGEGDGEETTLAVREESEEGGEEEEEETKPKITVDDIKTAPMDYRFPTTNQAKHCYTRYNEFHKCTAEKGDDAKECQKYAKYYRSLCPGEWIDKWNEEREAGTFPGRY